MYPSQRFSPFQDIFQLFRANQDDLETVFLRNFGTTIGTFEDKIITSYTVGSFPQTRRSDVKSITHGPSNYILAPVH